jgi:hypothetical protein
MDSQIFNERYNIVAATAEFDGMTAALDLSQRKIIIKRRKL